MPVLTLTRQVASTAEGPREFPPRAPGSRCRRRHPAEVAGAAASAYDSAAAPLVLRPKAAVEAFLAGFTAEPPGLVQAPLRRPESAPRPRDLKKTGIYAAVAAKN